MVSEAMCRGKGCYARPGNLSSEGLCERCSPGATKHFVAPAPDLGEVLERLTILEETMETIKEWFQQERVRNRKTSFPVFPDTVTTPAIPEVHYHGCNCITCGLRREGR